MEVIMHNNLGLLTLLATFAVGCAPASPIHSMGGADPVLQQSQSIDLCGDVGTFQYNADRNTIIFGKAGSPASITIILLKQEKTMVLTL